MKTINREINHECYVDLEVAELLKELGFDWECVKNYMGESHFLWTATTPGNLNDNSEVHKDWKSAPTLDVTQRWLRELKDILLYITPKKADNKYKWTFWYIDLRDLSDIEQRYSIQTFNTYEEAQEAGIKKALKLILEKGE